jgi:hypothetical protein
MARPYEIGRYLAADQGGAVARLDELGRVKANSGAFDCSSYQSFRSFVGRALRSSTNQRRNADQ